MLMLMLMLIDAERVGQAEGRGDQIHQTSINGLIQKFPDMSEHETPLIGGVFPP